MPGNGGTKTTPKVLAEVLAAALPHTQLCAGRGDRSRLCPSPPGGLGTLPVPPGAPARPGLCAPRVLGSRSSTGGM